MNDYQKVIEHSIQEENQNITIGNIKIFLISDL